MIVIIIPKVEEVSIAKIFPRYGASINAVFGKLQVGSWKLGISGIQLILPFTNFSVLYLYLIFIEEEYFWIKQD